LDFNVKTYDSHNSVTTGASWKFSAPISGTYRISTNIVLNAGLTWVAGNSIALTLRKNAGNVSSTLSMAQATHTTYQSAILTDTIKLVAGDYIDVRITQDSGDTAALAGGSEFNMISIERIGNY
jgi:hypothetical protein